MKGIFKNPSLYIPWCMRSLSCLHDLKKEGRKSFYLMIKDNSDSERETCCCNLMGYFFQLAARDLLYTPSHRQDSTYQVLWYTSCEALVGMRNSSWVNRDTEIWWPIALWADDLPWSNTYSAPLDLDSYANEGFDDSYLFCSQLENEKKRKNK